MLGGERRHRVGLVFYVDALNGWTLVTTEVARAAADAQLLVVGARGRGGFDEMSLGSIAEAVLLYAPGPIAVVRQVA